MRHRTLPRWSKLAKKTTAIHYLLITFYCLLTACGGVRQSSFYTLNLPDLHQTNGTAKASLPVVAGLQKLDGGVLYSDDRIIFRENDFEIKYWHYHRWVAAPNALATEALRDFLLSEKVFADVVRFPSPTRVRYVISGRLLAFEEVDLDGEWFGKAGVELVLKEIGKESILWKGKFEHITRTERKRPESIVAAVNASLRKCFEQAAEALRERLREKGRF